MINKAKRVINSIPKLEEVYVNYVVRKLPRLPFFMCITGMASCGYIIIYCFIAS